MLITNEAKIILENYMKEENKKGIYFEAAGQGCHMQLGMDFTEEADGEMINGISVKMNDQTKAVLENCTLDAREGTLLFKAGGCGGCSSDDSSCCDGGCC